MPARSKVTELPEDVRKWLEDALIEGNFQRYEQLEQLLAEKGYSVGKSTLHRHGQKLQRKLDAIKASTDAARMIAEHAGDDADTRTGAVIALLQTDLFNVLVNLQEVEDANPAKRAQLLSGIARGVADLSKASVAQKKWQVEVREKLEAAANAVEKIAKKGGLSQDAVQQIRSQILGIQS